MPADIVLERRIFWHRDLPPADAEIVGEHTLDATSTRVPGTLANRDELWDRCYQALMAHTTGRLEQEMARLGGDYAHVVSEAIDSRHDDARGEAWLRGRFTYMLYRRPPH
jgi:hypothetical protein